MESSHPTSVRFPAPLRERLTATAQAERRALANLVRMLVEDGLEDRLEGYGTDGEATNADG
jgi:predicted DNA-binding protein